MKKIKNFFIFALCFVLARIVRVWNFYLDLRGRKIVVAAISNLRDNYDVRNFGFLDTASFPDVMPWVKFMWGDVSGQLFMIRSITEDFALGASIDKKEAAKQFFVEAVIMAQKKGAKFILYAAATKRLFVNGELESRFPGLKFTLGDNFTALLLVKNIEDALKRCEISPEASRILITGPYGLLGKVSLWAACEMKFKEVVAIGNRERENLMDKLANEFSFSRFYSYDDVGEFDLVIACTTSPGLSLNAKIIEKITPKHKKIVLVDSCQPAALPQDEYNKVSSRVVRFDSGNGFSEKTSFTLNWLSRRLMRLAPGELFGCFCELVLVASNENYWPLDLYQVVPDLVRKMVFFYGKGSGQIRITDEPTSYAQKITHFNRSLENEVCKKEIAETHSSFSAVKMLW